MLGWDHVCFGGFQSAYVGLQESAQVNHVDSEGRSALLWAAVHGSVARRGWDANMRNPLFHGNRIGKT